MTTDCEGCVDLSNNSATIALSINSIYSKVDLVYSNQLFDIFESYI